MREKERKHLNKESRKGRGTEWQGRKKRALSIG